METPKHLYSSNPKQLITWARKAKKIWITLPGTAGCNFVEAKKCDFIACMQLQQNDLETEYSYNPDTKTLYA